MPAFTARCAVADDSGDPCPPESRHVRRRPAAGARPDVARPRLGRRCAGARVPGAASEVRFVRVLLTGASGFLGAALADALRAAGHELVLAVRHPQPPPHAGDTMIAVDFTRDLAAEDWRPRLTGVDAVINAVGILREHGDQTFQSVHVEAPRALFDACVQAQVSRVLQISALGADAHAGSGYHRSKHAADEHLLSLPLSAVVVQPSLIFGPHGASTRMFSAAAALPLIPLPGRGLQCVQPVHLDDVCAAVLRLLEATAPPSRVALVGPQSLTLRAYLAALRGGLGLSRARFLPVPMPLVRAAVAIGAKLPGSLADADTLRMLERGNCADPAPISRLLGRPPHSADAFIGAAAAPALRCSAQLRLWLPLLRLSVALVWLVTGVLSIGVYPVADQPPARTPTALGRRFHRRGRGAGAALLGATAPVAAAAAAQRRAGVAGDRRAVDRGVSGR
ncbi:NAD-dependent epimerase/dehydratase family protein [Lysobacter sp. D1-1-M9]|uniref:NAD-dependent epimerase/dehydratase family protein n=1 Tax=Novilysobacter longmucuonensis TaxID=3098603 RepID=UPI002FC6C25B